jgi:hypothetical protein
MEYPPGNGKMEKEYQVAEDLYYIESSGNPEKIGTSYSSVFRTKLENAVRLSNRALDSRFDKRKIAFAIEQIGTNFKRNFYYLWEELESTSKGSGIPLINLQMHIFSAGIAAFINSNNGCTDIIFPKSDVGPLLGKTHDATSPVLGCAVVRLIRHESLNTILCVTRIDGFSTMTGLNDQGLAVGEASIHFYPVNKSGTIRNLLLRPLLHECSNVHEAVKFLSDHPLLSAGFHFALVDKSGDAAIVERSPVKQNVIWSKGKVIFCTNHAASPSMRKLEKSRGEKGDKNSDSRYENLVKITTWNKFEFTLDSLKKILKFHDNVGGICQHGDPQYTGMKLPFYPMITLRAFINIVKEKKLLVSNGNPCTNEFLEFRFE